MDRLIQMLSYDSRGSGMILLGSFIALLGLFNGILYREDDESLWLGLIVVLLGVALIGFGIRKSRSDPPGQGGVMDVRSNNEPLSSEESRARFYQMYAMNVGSAPEAGIYFMEGLLNQIDDEFRETAEKLIAEQSLQAAIQRIGKMDYYPRYHPYTRMLFEGWEDRARSILSSVRELRLSGDIDFYDYSEAQAKLDEALENAWRLHPRSLSDARIRGTLYLLHRAILRGHTKVYSARATMWERLAISTLLCLYEIVPTQDLSSFEEGRGKLVQYGSAVFGVTLLPEVPEIEYADEIVWLYQQAKLDYQVALRLDSTDFEPYSRLSEVCRVLGQPEESAQALHQALAALNKAVLADDSDENSYSRRAQVLEQLNEFDLAIADLQRVLTLAVEEDEIKSMRKEIERLRRRKEGVQNT